MKNNDVPSKIILFDTNKSKSDKKENPKKRSLYVSV